MLCIWRIGALDYVRRPKTRSRALREKILVDLKLRCGGGWERECCRKDEPAQRSEHRTAPERLRTRVAPPQYAK
jgi:hypothetical protein